MNWLKHQKYMQQKAQEPLRFIHHFYSFNYIWISNWKSFDHILSYYLRRKWKKDNRKFRDSVTKYQERSGHLQLDYQENKIMIKAKKLSYLCLSNMLLQIVGEEFSNKTILRWT